MMANRYIFKGLVFQARCGQVFLSTPKNFQTVPGPIKPSVHVQCLPALPARVKAVRV